MLNNLWVQAAGTAAGTAAGAVDAPARTTAPAAGNFLDLINGALQNVSTAQAASAAAEAGYVADIPGATLAKALVASDRAEVAWNATVAVRNEAVSAYQSIMNMQF